MRYLIDTNALSETVQRRPDAEVVARIRELPELRIALSTITFGEIEKGVSKLGSGERKAFLTRWLRDLPDQFHGRILPVDVAVARTWGRLADEGRRAGRELPVTDGLLLATAAVHRLVVVTRDESDFRGRGVEIFNPWNP